MALLYLGTGIAKGQREVEYKDYDKLLLWYIDENYEKVIRKGEKIIEDERKQPLPYIYVAKAYYEVSKLPEYKEEYDRAFKEALKYAGYFIKRDDKKKLIDDHSRFLNKLRREAIEIGKVEYEKGARRKRNYRKSRYYFKKIQRFSPNDPSPHFVEGLTSVKQGLERRARRPYQKGKELLKALDSKEELDPAQNDLMKFWVTEYSRHLVDKGNVDSAQKVVDIGKRLYGNDKEFLQSCDRILTQ